MKNKPLLIETVRIQNGRVRNIAYHNDRCNATRKVLFGSTDKIDLRKVIKTLNIESSEIKCRITYDEIVRNVAFESYTMRPIRSLKLIEIGDYEYAFKYADRSELRKFFDQRNDKDDILMTKNGFITDTYYANVALYKKGKWYTPKNPLLFGSQRSRLLSKSIILESEIHQEQIEEYKALSLFNAMIPFKKIIIDLSSASNLVE